MITDAEVVAVLTDLAESMRKISRAAQSSAAALRHLAEILAQKDNGQESDRG